MLLEEDFKNKYLQHPISFLSEENLDKLETHCRKASKIERGIEHKVVLELLDRYYQYQKEIQDKNNKLTKLQKENEDLQMRKDNQEKRFKKYKENIDKQHEEIYENLVSEKEKYKYLYQKALDNTVKSDRQNMQLKKQIDLILNEQIEDGYLVNFNNLEEAREYYIKLAKEKGE